MFRLSVQFQQAPLEFDLKCRVQQYVLRYRAGNDGPFNTTFIPPSETRYSPPIGELQICVLAVYKGSVMTFERMVLTINLCTICLFNFNIIY